MSERFLVTGGAGFLGSHLCERLIQNRKKVFCVDNFSSGRHENIEHLLDLPNFKLIQHDIRTPLSVEVDLIINMACPASPISYQADPIRTIETSILGSINMLNLAKNVGARILQASTSEVYGDPVVHPQPEDYWGNVNPIGPRSCYDEGKRCAETLFFDYHRQYGLRIKVVRIFNTYGPRMQISDGRVISNFIVQCLRGEPITVFGDGRQTRSFCYVDDLLDGVDRMIDTGDDFTGPINIGNPNEVAIIDIAEAISRKTKSKSIIHFLPLPLDDPKRRRPEISLARRRLHGWEPKVSFESGLDMTISYFKDLLQ